MSVDGDIIRNDFKHVGMSQPASLALARLEAAKETCDQLAEGYFAMTKAHEEEADERTRDAEAQRDALAEALRDLVAWADGQEAMTGTDALASLLLRLDRARAALAEAGL